MSAFEFQRRESVDIRKYLPRWLNEDETFNAVQSALNIEHERYRLLIQDMARQFFISEATWSLDDWEEFVDVRKFSDDMEGRRLRVRAKLLGAEVMTLANTNALIQSFTSGKNSYVDESARNALKIILRDRVIYPAELIDSLFELMPAHLALGFERRESEAIPIYAGAAEAKIGTQSLGFTLPKDQSSKLRVGFVIAQTGYRGGAEVGLPRILFGNRNRPRIAQGLVRTGEVIIDADLSDLPKREDLYESAIADLLIADVGIARLGAMKPKVEELKQYYSIPLKVGQMMRRGGAEVLGLNKPAQVAQKILAGQGLGRTGAVEIKTPPQVRTRAKTRLISAGAFYLSGQIIIRNEGQQWTRRRK